MQDHPSGFTCNTEPAMPSTATIDLITLWVFLTPAIIWIPWELALVLWLRPRAKRLGLPMPGTISMVARGLGYRVGALVYLWFGLGVHYWVNRAHWGPAWAGVLFWIIPLALLVWAILDRFSEVETWPRWKRVLLYPVTTATLGGLGGYFLFPQSFPW